jgi:hypothetical protein
MPILQVRKVVPSLMRIKLSYTITLLLYDLFDLLL